MGWENIFQVEKDEFCHKVLTKNFPNTIRYGDIKEFDGTKYRGAIDVLSGGFPCQPFSSAGKRMGKDDARHLWPEMLRVIAEIRPAYVLGENVRGLLNWNKGLVFDEVQIDLENKGYQVAPFLLPACSLQAPHNRARIFIIAKLNRVRCNKSELKWHSVQRTKFTLRKTDSSDSKTRNFTNFNSEGLPFGLQKWQQGIQVKAKAFKRSESMRGNPKNRWEKFPSQSPICGGIHGVSNRVDRIKGLGNAIVPQVAFEIFKAIEACETSLIFKG